jgi:protein ImuB
MAADATAREAGIRPGLRRGGVPTLAPGARMEERDEARESDALNGIAVAMMQFSPSVAILDEQTVLVEVGPSLRLFGGMRALCGKVRSVMDRLGFSARLCAAPTGRGAWLLARFASRRVVKLASLERVLAALPMQAVPEVRPFGDWFSGLGCASVADIRRLPRAGLKKRCGEHLLDTLDQAFGAAPEIFEWMEPPPAFAARIEFPDRIEDAQAMLFAANRLMLQLCGWLASRHLAANALSLLLEHERGRHAIEPTAVDIAFGEPAWQEAHIIRLVRERLGRTVLDAPAVAIRLEASRVQPLAPPCEDLFPEPGGTASDHARLLEILGARLGAENILRPAPVEDFRPEVANRWVPLSSDARGRPAPAGLPRPTWLLAEPVRLLVRGHRPFYGSPLRMVSPAERIEAGWFDGQLVTRDYYVAQGEDHSCYWIYLERVGSREAGQEPRWFLHGLFG